MTYTPPDAGLYGRTFSRLLNEGESETIGAVQEDNLVFERLFTICCTDPSTSAGILHTPEGGGETYIWKIAAAPAGTLVQGLEIGFASGTSCRLFCQFGVAIFSWRERFRLGT